MNLQFGLTWPLQRLLHLSVPYGLPQSHVFCWDMHCITLCGRSSLLLVHCASRYTCVRFDMTALDWERLAELAVDEIRQGLFDAGLTQGQIDRYTASPPELTRTHGRREVAFLNRAWEAVAAADLLVDRSNHRQPILNNMVNNQLCKCAGFEGIDRPVSFLRQCFQSTYGDFGR